ncbi:MULTISPECIES: UbiA family prenyltransferase [unclassified Streptomyces]|uniref:UbiA family prenyltransferase n=1 Tax=unclassified Streptomyces TaxID=2593676 RepID=UPI002E2E7A21|nr:UbiA family prenyltransferase [Streptomyces sp. NBC_00223]
MSSDHGGTAHTPPAGAADGLSADGPVADGPLPVPDPAAAAIAAAAADAPGLARDAAVPGGTVTSTGARIDPGRCVEGVEDAAVTTRGFEATAAGPDPVPGGTVTSAGARIDPGRCVEGVEDAAATTRGFEATAGPDPVPGGTVTSAGARGSAPPVSASPDTGPCAPGPAPAAAPADGGARTTPVGGAGRRAPGAAVRGLVRACHPEPAVAVTALVTALAAASGQTAAGCVLVALAVLAGQVSVGWSNDLLDLRRDTAAGRTDKPLVAGVPRPRTVRIATGAAVPLCVAASLACGPAAGAAHLAGVAAAWAYNAGLKRTLWSWLPYAVAFGLLPAFVTLGLPARPAPPAWALAAGALLGVGAHITNVLPDIEADLATGVRGLPQRLGHRRSRLLAPMPLLCAAAVLVLGPPGPPGAAGWTALAVTAVAALATVAPAAARPHTRLPFLATLAMAATSVGLLLLRGHALT